MYGNSLIFSLGDRVRERTNETHREKQKLCPYGLRLVLGTWAITLVAGHAKMFSFWLKCYYLTDLPKCYLLVGSAKMLLGNVLDSFFRNGLTITFIPGPSYPEKRIG